jgi:hypothetical protein
MKVDADFLRRLKPSVKSKTASMKTSHRTKPTPVSAPRRHRLSLLVTAFMLLVPLAVPAANVKLNVRVNMVSTGVDPDAKGTLTGTMSRNDNGSNQRLKLALANLDPNTTYQLIAFLGDDTNYTDVAEITTDDKGAFAVTYVQKCPTSSSSRPRGEPLPTTLDPISRIHQLDVVSGGNVVLNGVVGNDFPSDCAAATVVSTDPLDGAIEVPVNQPITVTFSEPMNPSTITKSTFNVKQGGRSVPGTVTYSNGTATLTPMEPLATDTTYTATINSRVKDLGGNKLAGDHVWTFSTAPVSVNPNPMVDFTVPFNTAVDVPVGSTITATFNEGMDLSTINPTTFTLMGPGGEPIAGTVVFDEVTYTASFIPTTPLATNTYYTATINSAVTDLDGNPLLTDHVWNFTTSETPAGQVSVANDAAATVAGLLFPAARTGPPTNKRGHQATGGLHSLKDYEVTQRWVRPVVTEQGSTVASGRALPDEVVLKSQAERQTLSHQTWRVADQRTA